MQMLIFGSLLLISNINPVENFILFCIVGVTIALAGINSRYCN